MRHVQLHTVRAVCATPFTTLCATLCATLWATPVLADPPPAPDLACTSDDALAHGLVVLSSVSCRPCRELGRALRAQEDVVSALGIDVHFIYADCSHCGEPELQSLRSGDWPSFCAEERDPWVRELHVTPVLLAVSDGEVLEVHVGALDDRELLSWLTNTFDAETP